MTTVVEATTGLEAAWAALRRHHPTLPKAVITVSSRWTGDSGGATDVGPRVLIYDGILAEGSGRKAFEVLAHQAAHVLAQARGVVDVSPMGRHHNGRFVALAEELGLVVGPMRQQRGRDETTLADAMAARYAPEIKILDALLRDYVVSPPPEQDKQGRGHRVARRDQIKVRCACRSFRIPESKFYLAPIRCMGCGKDFWAV